MSFYRIYLSPSLSDLIGDLKNILSDESEDGENRQHESRYYFDISNLYCNKNIWPRMSVTLLSRNMDVVWYGKQNKSFEPRISIIFTMKLLAHFDVF